MVEFSEVIKTAFASSRLKKLETYTKESMRVSFDFAKRLRELKRFRETLDNPSHVIGMYSELLRGQETIDMVERKFAQSFIDLTEQVDDYSYALTSPFSAYNTDNNRTSKERSEKSERPEIPVLYAPTKDASYEGVLRYLKEEPINEKLIYLKTVREYTRHFESFFRNVFNDLKFVPDSQLQRESANLYHKILSTRISTDVLSYHYRNVPTVILENVEEKCAEYKRLCESYKSLFEEEQSMRLKLLEDSNRLESARANNWQDVIFDLQTTLTKERSMRFNLLKKIEKERSGNVTTEKEAVSENMAASAKELSRPTIGGSHTTSPS